VIGFLQPLALLALGAAAIPPLLHLMGRRRPPTVVFPAVRYLTATEREHSRRLKLRNLLLLLLRVAVIVLIVLAAARPVARVGAGTGHPPTALALVVDNSLSSGAVVQGRPVLDVLRERAGLVLGRVRTEDRVWLVLADGVPRRLGSANAGALLDTLGSWPVRLDLAEAVRAAGRAVSDAPQAIREVVVVSDLQASALTAGRPVAERVLVWAPPAEPRNRGIDSAWAEPPIWSSGGEVVAVVGGDATEPAAVRLLLGGRDAARAVAAPGDRMSLRAQSVDRGWVTAAVALDPDELNADDRWWLAVRVAEPAAVRAAEGAGPFVEQAVEVLREGGRAASGDDVLLADRPGDHVTVLFPPSDPALLGAANRALAARGVAWRFGELIEGEWTLEGALGAASGTPVYRRHRLVGSGSVLARVAGEAWLVRAGDVVIVASRMDDAWTALPVSAAFLPFLDRVVNRIAAAEAWLISGAPGAMVELPPGTVAMWLPQGTVDVGGDSRVRAPVDPGVYFLRGAAGDTIGALEVNHDRRESRLHPADPSAVRAALGSAVQVLDDGAMARELFHGARRADLTGMLLVAALAAALVEMGLASGAAAARGD
jgi:hypothetical protein